MDRMQTTKQGEDRISTILNALVRLRTAHLLLQAEEVSVTELKKVSLDKLYALRLALAVSMKDPNRPPPPIGQQGADYNMQQVTGYGGRKGLDFTNALRAMLSVLHEDDLFKTPPSDAPHKYEQAFVQLVGAHVHRGLERICEALDTGTELIPFLLTVLFPEKASGYRSDSLVARLKSHELHAELLETVTSGKGIGHHLRFQSVDDLNRLDLVLDDLSFDMGWPSGSAFVLRQDSQHVWLEHGAAVSEWISPSARDYAAWRSRPVASDTQSLLLAMRGEGEPITLGLQSKSIHLVAGAHQSGKTILLQSLVTQWIERVQANGEVWIFDEDDGGPWKPFRSIAGVTVLSAEDLSRDLNELPAWLDEKRSRSAKVHARRLLVIDNAEALLLARPGLQKVLLALDLNASPIQKRQDPWSYDCRERFKTVAWNNTCILVATTATHACELVGHLKPESKTALRLDSEDDSMTLLGTPGAARLRGRGDVLWRQGNRLLRGHTLGISAEELCTRLTQ